LNINFIDVISCIKESVNWMNNVVKNGEIFLYYIHINILLFVL